MKKVLLVSFFLFQLFIDLIPNLSVISVSGLAVGAKRN
mgnify:CR=1 FL=1